MEIHGAIKAYIDWKYKKYRRAAENNASYLRRFADWWIKETGKSRIQELDDVDAGKFQNYMEDRNYAQSTIALFMIAIRDLVKYFYLKKVTNFNFQLIQVPAMINRYFRSAIKNDQVRQISSIIGENLLIELRDKLIINFLGSSGVRVSELTALNAKEVDYNIPSISIPNKKHPNGHRVICWDDETHRLIMLWLEKRNMIAKDDALFLSFQTFKRLSDRQVQRIVKKHAVRAGLSKTVSPHCFRHGFIQDAIVDLDLTKAQDLAGHKNINSTKKYAQWKNTELQKEYQMKFRKVMHSDGVDLDFTPRYNIYRTVKNQ